MAVLRAAGAGVHPRVAWWRDLPPLAVGYAAYACVRDLRGRDTSAVAYRVAEQHALSLRAVEQRLGIAIEGGLQARVLPLRPVVQVAATFYSTAHFLVTAGVLAASRLLPASYGYVDALQLVGAGAWSYDRGVLEHISDPFAAVPSLHMAWATCVGVGLWPTGGPAASPGGRTPGVGRLPGTHLGDRGGHRKPLPARRGRWCVAVVAGAAGLRSGVAAVRRGGRWIPDRRAGPVKPAPYLPDPRTASRPSPGCSASAAPPSTSTFPNSAAAAGPAHHRGTPAHETGARNLTRPPTRPPAGLITRRRCCRRILYRSCSDPEYPGRLAGGVWAGRRGRCRGRGRDPIGDGWAACTRRGGRSVTGNGAVS